MTLLDDAYSLHAEGLVSGSILDMPSIMFFRFLFNLKQDRDARAKAREAEMMARDTARRDREAKARTAANRRRR